MELGAQAQQLLVILFAAAFTENILLARFLGMCSFLAVSRQIKTATGLGLAVIFVLSFTTVLNLWVYRLLVALELEYLRFIAFIVVIAAFVQFVEIVIERFSPVLYYALGIFLPLITVNCAVLGVTLFMILKEDFTSVSAFVYGAGSGLGWTLAIIAMAGIREKMQRSRVPRGLEGPGIALIIAGIMALAFMGLTGIISTG
jgi:Na+-transporting NADH:ubiquinone oxidoreductase subunit E